MAVPIFEVGDDQPTPLECEERDGRTILRLRRDTRVTPCLVQAINDILQGEDGPGSYGPPNDDEGSPPT